MDIVETLRETLKPLKDATADFDPVMELVGDAQVVMLGEASHGTHEFYAARAAITERLVAEKQFNAVVVEADWPDAYRVNRYVCGRGSDRDAITALDDFRRFPTWMWRNSDVVLFVEWLREFNERVSPDRGAVGFYGMDLYSLYASIGAVLRYLERIDPVAARTARARYSCFDHFGEDVQAYGHASAFGLDGSCEDEAISELIDLRRQAAEYASRDGHVARDDYFFAEQNARLIKNAEEYYRSMFRGRVLSWNLRDQHMAETLDELMAFLTKEEGHAKAIVWAHNSHLGDARATEMGQSGELNVGQLVRERYGRRRAVSIGFTTYVGTVTAASDWDAPTEIKRVRPALAGSYEQLLHDTDVPRFFLPLHSKAGAALANARLERAIGVIYRPETERASHYFHANLPAQFDAVIHFDHTTALRPLESTATLVDEEVPETFPTGI